jgi:hypothetical protein
MTTTRLVLAIAVLLAAAGRLSAQDDGARRVAFDTVIGVQDFFEDGGNWPTQVIVDAFTEVEVRRGWQVGFRPKLWRAQGEWELLVDQMSIRRDFRKGSDWRVEAGRFASPVGLGMMENCANLNPGVLWWHRPYYAPLPSLGAGMPRVSLVSAVYPNGVQLATSTTRWDARAALVDTAPVKFWYPTPGASMPRAANTIVGAGITPRQGARIGVGAAWGLLTRATEGRPAGRYALFNVEGELGVAHTKVSGEWTRDRFDTPHGAQSAMGLTLQAVQTLSPRVFAHARVSRVHAPAAVSAAPSGFVERDYTAVDATAGYLLSQELTLRVGYAAIARWQPDFDHQVGVSLMWSKRWW